jgi:chlorite dismutase
MPEQTLPVLSHFSLLRFRDAFFNLSPAQRQSNNQRLLEDLRRSAAAVQVYQIYPTQSGIDLLIWSSQPLGVPSDPAAFFERLACATLPYRPLLEPVQALWGYTRPSQYTRARSTQELDPLAAERRPYLVIYPFVKTADWYLLAQEARQGMMNGHIKVGKQFPEISQLLLYSFGLQDQEFVVVYEMDDLVQFSDLVYALRATDARRYTLRDAPLYTAIHHPAEQTLALWE